MLILLSKNSFKISNFEKRPKTNRNLILDFWLTREFCVSAKSPTPEQLKLRNRVKDIKCLSYYLKNPLKISNFEKRPKTSRNLILDFWLTREFCVSAKSPTPERLQLCNRVKDIKCLFYHLKNLRKISNFEKRPRTSKLIRLTKK